MVCLDLKYSQPQGFSVIEILTKTLKNRSRFDSTAPQEIYAGQHNLKWVLHINMFKNKSTPSSWKLVFGCFKHNLSFFLSTMRVEMYYIFLP